MKNKNNVRIINFHFYEASNGNDYMVMDAKPNRDGKIIAAEVSGFGFWSKGPERPINPDMLTKLHNIED